jgi:hypothetical protein
MGTRAPLAGVGPRVRRAESSTVHEHYDRVAGVFASHGERPWEWDGVVAGDGGGTADIDVSSFEDEVNDTGTTGLYQKQQHQPRAQAGGHGQARVLPEQQQAEERAAQRGGRALPPGDKENAAEKLCVLIGWRKHNKPFTPHTYLLLTAHP